MTKPRLLDLFCGAGGCSRGYADAGFDVTGVDLAPQPHYPYAFIQADALTFPLDGFDVIHASPPCQAYTLAKTLPGYREHPALVPAVRQRLIASGLLWVMENVPGAPMLNPLILCGGMFGLKVRRHRLFDSNLLLFAPGICRHDAEMVTVYGDHIRKWKQTPQGKRYEVRYPTERGRAAMGIDWMTQRELSQAIPPAYTRWIGEQLLPVVLAGRQLSA